MADKVVLHVGLMKSGTTFIQRQLFAHQATLRQRGTLVPGARWVNQTTAVQDLLRRPDRRTGRWDAMAAEIRDWPGTVLISMEFLGPARPSAIEHLVASVAPARVEVVITARDLNRTIATLWQETIQNGRTWTRDEYVDSVRAACPWHDPREVGDAGRTFWRQQDLAGIAEAWSAAAERTSLVTVPHPGASRNLLLDRFTAAAGIGELPVVETPGNESLGGASTLALRRMNELLDEQQVDFRSGQRIRKGVLAKQVLASRRDDEPRLALPVPDWAVVISDELVARTQKVPLELVGDWAELAPVAVPGVAPDDVPTEAVTEAALAGLAGLIQRRAAT